MAAYDEKMRRSLYVGDLHPDVTEKDLYQTFSRVAPLASVHLCRDKFSPNYNSLCYAYVNFWLPSHASAALKCLNHYPLKGKTIRIMWYESDPIAKRNNNGNLFVKNIDESITSARLQHIFAPYGTILSCKVSEENGFSQGFGFVQFESVDSAIAACNALHGCFLNGKKLYVSKFIRKSERNRTKMCFRSLFVKNLDEDITEDVLTGRFSKYGKVRNAVIMKDEKGKSKGFGFVNFDSQEAAKRAMRSLNGKLLGSKNIIVARAVKKSERIRNFMQMPGYMYPYCCKDLQSSNMFGDNLHGSVIGKNLSAYGTVHSGNPIWNSGVGKRFGYTCFSYPDNSKMALNSATGANPKGKNLNVAFAKLTEQDANRFCNKPQPFYAPNGQPLRPSFPYFSPIIPFKQPSSLDPTVYRYFARDIHATFNALGLRIAGLRNGVKDQQTSSPAKLGNNGHEKEFSKGSCTKKNLCTRQGCKLQPLVTNNKRGSDCKEDAKSPKKDESPSLISCSNLEMGSIDSSKMVSMR